MSRPYDWQPLATSDPVPGDPAVIEQGAEHYAAIAKAIREAHTSLNEIMTKADYQSEAVAALRERAKEVQGELDRVLNRYQATGTALGTYADELRSAQSIADSALVDAQGYSRQYNEARENAAWWDRQANNADADGDPERASHCRREADDERGRKARMLNLIADLREGEMVRAVKKRDNAADAARSAIGDAADDDLNDGWWDNWGSKVVGIISTVATAVAAIAGVLALVLCWVPVIGQALAAIALIATAVAFVADFALAATGEKGWDAVMWDGIALATFGVGRLATSAFKVAALTRGVQSATRAAEMTARADRVVTAGRVFVVSETEVTVVAIRTVETTTRLEAPIAATFQDVFQARGGMSTLLSESLGPRAVLGDLASDLGGLRTLGSTGGQGSVFSQGFSNLTSGSVTSTLTNIFVGQGEANILGAANAERASSSSLLNAFGASSEATAAVMGHSPVALTGAAAAVPFTFDAAQTVGDFGEGFGEVSVPDFDFTSWITGQSETRSAPGRLNLP